MKASASGLFTGSVEEHPARTQASIAAESAQRIVFGRFFMESLSASQAV